LIIYKATCKNNNKVYIGQTIKSLNKRSKEHWSDTKDENRHAYFHKALLKHGKDNFTWEIIEECCSQEQLDNREIYWIEYYKATDKEFGYNLSKGGQAGKGIGQETLSNLWKTEEFREKMKEATRKGSRKINEEDIAVIKGAKLDGYSTQACAEFFNIANSSIQKYYYYDYPPEIKPLPANEWNEKYYKIFELDFIYKEKTKINKANGIINVINYQKNNKKLSEKDIGKLKLFW